MFVISNNGHLGFWWGGDTPIFVEKDSGIFPSRKSVLEYLQKFHSKEKAIEIIMMIQDSKGKSTFSF